MSSYTIIADGSVSIKGAYCCCGIYANDKPEHVIYKHMTSVSSEQGQKKTSYDAKVPEVQGLLKGFAHIADNNQNPETPINIIFVSDNSAAISWINKKTPDFADTHDPLWNLFYNIKLKLFDTKKFKFNTEYVYSRPIPDKIIHETCHNICYSATGSYQTNLNKANRVIESIGLKIPTLRNVNEKFQNPITAPWPDAKIIKKNHSVIVIKQKDVSKLHIFGINKKNSKIISEITNHIPAMQISGYVSDEINFVGNCMLVAEKVWAFHVRENKVVEMSVFFN